MYRKVYLHLPLLAETSRGIDEVSLITQIALEAGITCGKFMELWSVPSDIFRITDASGRHALGDDMLMLQAVFEDDAIHIATRLGLVAGPIHDAATLVNVLVEIAVQYRSAWQAMRTPINMMARISLSTLEAELSNDVSVRWDRYCYAIAPLVAVRPSAGIVCKQLKALNKLIHHSPRELELIVKNMLELLEFTSNFNPEVFALASQYFIPTLSLFSMKELEEMSGMLSSSPYKCDKSRLLNQRVMARMLLMPK